MHTTNFSEKIDGEVYVNQDPLILYMSIQTTRLTLISFEFFSCIINILPWFQRFIFIIFIAKGRWKINLWLKAAIDSSSRANQFELGSDPDSVS